MSNLINLTFETANPIRIIDQNGDYWFVANDVCNILEIQNTTQALQSLDDDEKAKIDTTSSPMFNIGVHKGVKEINIINESGLYTLILRSRKAMQKGTVQHKFRKWVTAEVLPTLRKTGSYTIAKPSVPALKPQSPKLSQSDYATVRRAVYFLSKNMYHTGTATNVIYARLRSLCEVEHMADIRYDQLTIVQNELYRIERILRAYTNYRQQTEKTLMSRICMGDSEVVGQAMIAMETTATAYAQVFDEATSAVAYANKVTGEGK